jgi:glycerol-3-phosphate acyltransferase PlsX
MAKTGLMRFKKRLDYEEYGGAPLLGLNAPLFVGHGSAGRRSIAVATEMTAAFIANRANEDIKHGLEMNPEITKFQKLRKMLHSSNRGQAEEEEHEDE